MASLREQLYQLCVDYIASRSAEIKKVIAEAQEAAANETKSSAGVKYETGREVMQQEINLNLARLNEMNKLRAALNNIMPNQTGAIALPGSVVYTSIGNYYISISAGLLKADGENFYAISPASPIGSKLIGRQAGYSFESNGKFVEVEKVI